MKVGTDGVLIGAWARIVTSHRRYLDIGTGTGLIALMIAQRTECVAGGGNVRIDAVEIDVGSAGQARENVAASPWGDRIGVYHADVHDFVPEDGGLYDHIVANPPWFVDSLSSPSAARTAARHARELTYGDLADCVARLLSADGMFSVILPADNEAFFVAVAAARGLVPARRTYVHSLPTLPPKRVMLELVREENASGQGTVDRLVIENSHGGHYTEEYAALTRDFYLKF